MRSIAWTDNVAPRYAVDAAIQTIALGEASARELLQERGIAHLLAAAFAVGQHPYMIEAPLRDHEAAVISSSLPISSRIQTLFAPSLQ
jgi:hypothetical protein